MIKTKTAYVAESPKAKGNVFIPKYIEDNCQKYTVIKICDKAFANSKIESLNFPQDSAVKVIGNSVFSNTDITKIFIPKNLIKLDDLWCENANKLKEIEVDKKNQFFSIKNKFLIYKKEEDFEILFAPRDFEGEYLVPEGVTRIGNYSFSRCKGITSLKSISGSLVKVGSHSFDHCENLESVDFNQDSTLILDSFCFSFLKICL